MPGSAAHDVGRQALPVSVSRQHHRALRHGWVPRQSFLHLVQLYPVASYFHLPVCTGDEDKITVGQRERAIASAIHAAACSEGIIHESAAREFRLPEVTSRHARAPDVQLAGHSCGKQRSLVIKNVSRGVGEWLADWKRLSGFPARCARFIDGRSWAVLGRPVSIKPAQPIAGRLAPCMECGGIGAFHADHHGA